MADAYWRLSDSRQPAVSLPHHLVKRPRSDFEMSSDHHAPSYYAYDNEGAGQLVTRDTDSVNALYEHYLRTTPISSYGTDTGLDGLYEIDDLRVLALGRSKPGSAAQSQLMGVGGWPEILLPPDASSTLFVEGLPVNCTRREVSHIFRPFVGYKEVRLVNKESGQSGVDLVVLCFVDFESPSHAATARDALQGYIFDEHDHDSGNLKLQFTRCPGASSCIQNHGDH